MLKKQLVQVVSQFPKSCLTDSLRAVTVDEQTEFRSCDLVQEWAKLKTVGVQRAFLDFSLLDDYLQDIPEFVVDGGFAADETDVGRASMMLGILYLLNAVL